MSLRYAGRVAAQGVMRAAQAAKEQATRSIKDAAASATATASASPSAASSAPSKQVRRLSSAHEGGSGPARAAVLRGEDRQRRAEESLRTVMYLSCWGPN